MLTDYTKELAVKQPHYNELLKRKEAGEKLEMRYFDVLWMFKLEGVSNSELADLYNISGTAMQAKRYKWELKQGRQIIHFELLEPLELVKLAEFSQKYQESNQEM